MSEGYQGCRGCQGWTWGLTESVSPEGPVGVKVASGES